MPKFKLFLTKLGFEGWMVLVTGLTAIVIGLLDFIPKVNITSDLLLRMILIALGLLMGGIASQTGRRELELTKLRDAIGTAEIDVLEANKVFPQRLVQSALHAQKFVLDTALNYEYDRIGEDPQRQYKQALDKRLKHGDINFKRVEVIFNKERLKRVLTKLIKYEGLEYLVRYYEAPPKPIPVLHLMSFDNDHFYIGGFYPAESPAEELVIYIRSPKLVQFFSEYWDELWHRAKPLNEGKRIDWPEAKRLSLRLGMTESEFDSMIRQLRIQVKRSRDPIQK